MKNKQEVPTPTFSPPHPERGNPARRAAYEYVTPADGNCLPGGDTSHLQGGRKAKDSRPLQTSLKTHLTPLLWSKEPNGNLQATFSPSVTLKIPAKPVRKVSTHVPAMQQPTLNFSSPQDPTYHSSHPGNLRTVLFLN